MDVQLVWDTSYQVPIWFKLYFFICMSFYVLFKINCLWSPRGLFLVRPCFRDNPSFDRIWSWKSGNVTLKIHDTVCARQPLPERVGLFLGFDRNGSGVCPKWDKSIAVQANLLSVFKVL